MNVNEERLAQTVVNMADMLAAKERDITALGQALDATVKERDAADRDVENLARDAADLVESHRKLLHVTVAQQGTIVELTARLDAERIGLQVAQRKRADTRTTLTTAFAELSNALWMARIDNSAHPA